MVLCKKFCLQKACQRPEDNSDIGWLSPKRACAQKFCKATSQISLQQCLQSLVDGGGSCCGGGLAHTEQCGALSRDTQCQNGQMTQLAKTLERGVDFPARPSKPDSKRSARPPDVCCMTLWKQKIKHTFTLCDWVVIGVVLTCWRCKWSVCYQAAAHSPPVNPGHKWPHVHATIMPAPRAIFLYIPYAMLRDIA